MLLGIINTQPTLDVALGLVSTRAINLISTFVRPYGPCTQVDIGLVAPMEIRPRTTSSFGFVYVYIYIYIYMYIYINTYICIYIYIYIPTLICVSISECIFKIN